jgi:ribonuclease HI
VFYGAVSASNRLTDDEYQAKQLRTAQGKRPSNIDLFLKIDEMVSETEASGKAEVGFWHIPRECNQLADSLAKLAVRDTA